MADKRINCPNCFALVEPKEEHLAAGSMLICPECFKLIGKA
jgi:hypothetical protein